MAKKSPPPPPPPAPAPPPAELPDPVPGEPRPFHKIRRLEVTGGYLDGLAVDFDDHLNCLIGGRGTGKTTVLEFLRFAFQGRPDDDTPFDTLIQKNLDTGTLRVVVETKDGERYSVQRTASGEPEIRDNNEDAVSFAHLAAGGVFDVDVFSQHQIEEIAMRPAAQLALLDRFAQSELRDVQDRIEGLLNALRANARELVDHERETATLQRSTDELPAFEARLAALPEVSGAAAETIARELALKKERDEEGRVLERLRPLVQQEQAALTKAGGVFEDVASLFGETPKKGPNAPVFDVLLRAARTARERIDGALGAATGALREFAAALDTAAGDLSRRHAGQERAYLEVVARHGEQRALADERAALERRVGELRERKRVREAREAARRQLLERRRALLGELSTLRDQRAAIRSRVADMLSERLQPDIRVRVVQGKDTTKFVQLMNAALKGVGRPYQDLTKAVAKRYSPADFVRAVHEGTKETAIGALATHLDVKPGRAEILVEGIRDTEAAYELDVCDVEDAPVIELLVGDQHKSAEHLSTGQKCTTILPILLIESERPLLIDQPEDNLDNSYVFTSVVRRIVEVKGQRQLVFVTHNPNIPVLGNAGKVVVMAFLNNKGVVKAAGTVDEVRGHVEEILEGGEKAFQERKRRYGY